MQRPGNLPQHASIVVDSFPRVSRIFYIFKNLVFIADTSYRKLMTNKYILDLFMNLFYLL